MGCLYHPLKAFHEAQVVVFCPFGRAFQMVFAALPRFLRQVALHQQRVDIIIRVPSAALVDSPRTLAQRKDSDALILCDYNISPPTKIDEGDIDRVRSGPDHFDRAVI